MKLFLSIMAALVLIPASRTEDKPSKPEATTVSSKRYVNVDAETFDKMRKADKESVVLDVRTREEYNKGHVPGSVLLDFISPDFQKEVSKLDKNKTYLVHCASGGRSARACKKMDTLGFSKLYNLEGGMAAWEKAGKPVDK